METMFVALVYLSPFRLIQIKLFSHPRCVSRLAACHIVPLQEVLGVAILGDGHRSLLEVTGNDYPEY